MGIAAASATPESSAANTSAERAQRTISASGASFSAASWLNEPGSPWIAIFMLLSLAPGRESRGSKLHPRVHLAPYHTWLAAIPAHRFLSIFTGGGFTLGVLHNEPNKIAIGRRDSRG